MKSEPWKKGDWTPEQAAAVRQLQTAIDRILGQTGRIETNTKSTGRAVEGVQRAAGDQKNVVTEVTEVTIPGVRAEVETAQATANAADTKAQEALDRPAGGTEIIFASRAPTADDVQPDGTVWYHRNGTDLVGQYLRESGAWVQQSIDSGLIADVLVGKRIEGGEIIGGTISGDLVMQSNGRIISKGAGTNGGFVTQTAAGVQTAGLNSFGVMMRYADGTTGIPDGSLVEIAPLNGANAGGLAIRPFGTNPPSGLERVLFVGTRYPRLDTGVAQRWDVDADRARIGNELQAGEVYSPLYRGPLARLTRVETSKVVSSRGDEILPGYFQINNLRSSNASTFTQTIASATWTVMTVPTPSLASHITLYDTMGLYIGGDRIYVQADGLYEFDVNGVFGNATGGTARSIAFSVNGSTAYVWESANRQPSYVNAVLLQRAFAKLALKKDDYVQVVFRQDSGGNLGLCRIENYGIKFIGSN